MNSFYEHHRDSIHWHYRCFDRILLNGLIQPFQQPERVVGFFNTYRQLTTEDDRCPYAAATAQAPESKNRCRPNRHRGKGRWAVFALELLCSGCMSSRKISPGWLAGSGTRNDVTI